MLGSKNGWLECNSEKLIERGRFLVRDPEHEHLDFEPAEALDQLVGASIHYRVAIGPNAGKKALTLRTVPARPEPFASTLLATQPGFFPARRNPLRGQISVTSSARFGWLFFLCAIPGTKTVPGASAPRRAGGRTPSSTF